MIGVLITTHGNLGNELISAAELIKGSIKGLIHVSVDESKGLEELKKEINTAIKKLDHGKGVLILTDLFGGTPSNLAISVMSLPNVEVLAGINLPMLVKLAKIRAECPLAESVVAAQESGRKYITIASRVLAGK